jgi:hypothetical protein
LPFNASNFRRFFFLHYLSRRQVAAVQGVQQFADPLPRARYSFD